MLVFVDLSFTVRTLALAVFPCTSQVNTANVRSFSTVQSPDIGRPCLHSCPPPPNLPAPLLVFQELDSVFTRGDEAVQFSTILSSLTCVHCDSCSASSLWCPNSQQAKAETALIPIPPVPC